MDMLTWLPNWRDVSKYPCKKKTTPTQWAWEFFRRNIDYQTCYDEYVRPFLGDGTINEEAARAYERQKKCGAAAVAANKGKTVNVFGPDGIIREKFGVLSYAAPEDPYPPIFPNRKSRIISSGEENYKEIPLTVFKDELFVYFRTDVPLSSQLKKLKLRLALYFAHLEKLPSFRYRPAPYQEYLRILDAKAADASNTEIATCIYRCEVGTPSYNSALKKIHNNFPKAKLLRDKDYCRIALGYSE